MQQQYEVFYQPFSSLQNQPIFEVEIEYEALITVPLLAYPLPSNDQVRSRRVKKSSFIMWFLFQNSELLI